ncbi:hypothetical protein LL912_01190 [Niabella sp. CC-SYL272]|uniref:hypothetical protein n=1 Tax=Niabella agricola TaxID=2891571 RepID=UPI001F27298A|nr:hypothetical protein [Niabella agricola]MCF3107383.1 hypothetical protein [Niabella agricola]
MYNKQAASASTDFFGEKRLLLFDPGVQCVAGQTAEHSFDLDFCSTFGQAKVEKEINGPPEDQEILRLHFVALRVTKE